MPKTINDKLISLIPDATLIVSIILAYCLNRTFPIVEIIPWPFSAAGWLFVAAGIVLTLSSISVIRFNNKTSNVTDVPPTLIKKGLYAFSRNPFYLSYVIILIGVAIILGSLGASAGPVVCAVVLSFVIRFEEAKLNDVFGKEYHQYMRSVRRWV